MVEYTRFEISMLRFRFGKNWLKYIGSLQDEDINRAALTLQESLGPVREEVSTFLDIGSGSGLSSLAAIKIGYKKVVSFDFDEDSVRATKTLRDVVGSDSERWSIYQGSVLDMQLIRRLGQYDVVYSWGVLHHTGAMWNAIGNATELVSEEGRILFSIYNNQGLASRYWWCVKWLYNRLPILRVPLTAFFGMYFASLYLASDIVNRRTLGSRFKSDKRGMKFWVDLTDWLGGFPFEVASPFALREFMERKGFECIRESLVGKHRHGCNEFVFKRINTSR